MTINCNFAFSQRKKFDAVYYYMRSLMASNPFFTARESLLALFDENRKKVSPFLSIYETILIGCAYFFLKLLDFLYFF